MTQDLAQDLRVDIRDADAVRHAVADCGADVLVHMAAQPLVRESYRNPRYTYETNVNGTLNVLEALSAAPNTRAALIITTDKVYRNDGREQGYCETDALGGTDPYSTSKAMADLLTQSWMRTSAVPVSIARAGNVIGGGDVCAERLLPDLVQAHRTGTATTLRNPNAVRPWQHVLDCLDGYLSIIDALLLGAPASAWNIGPGEASTLTVGEVASRVADQLGMQAFRTVAEPEMHEAQLLNLDITKARAILNWTPRLTVEDAIFWTTAWHIACERDDATARVQTLQQIVHFDALARA